MATHSVEATLRLQQAVAAMRCNEFGQALLLLDAALSYEPDDPVIHWNKATSLLSLGDYPEGFMEFEWRWKMYDWRWGLLGEDIYRVRELPSWRGQDLQGKHLLFYWEMGYGDCIQQLRYVPLLKALGAHVTMLVVKPLRRLARTLRIDVITKMPDDLSVFDYRCSLFGVMSALKETVDSIPQSPYVPILCRYGDGKRVGLAWSGRTQTEFTIESFLASLDLKGFRLHALQPGHVSGSVLPLSAEDFYDTALLIACMDHIITVDTAVVHLAGAMGHRSTHVLLPYLSDWRWHHGNAWYPTLKFYRQKNPGDWAEPFAMLNGALRWSYTSSSTDARLVGSVTTDLNAGTSDIAGSTRKTHTSPIAGTASES